MRFCVWVRVCVATTGSIVCTSVKCLLVLVWSVQFRFYFSPRPYLADLWSVKKLFDFTHRRMILNCKQTWMRCRQHCKWQKSLSKAMSLKECFFVFIFEELWKTNCAYIQISSKNIPKDMPQIKNEIIEMLKNCPSRTFYVFFCWSIWYSFFFLIKVTVYVVLKIVLSSRHWLALDIFK